MTSTWLILVAGLLGSITQAQAEDTQATSQQAPGAVHREKMKQLDFLVGEWRGGGWMILGPGQRSTFRQSEKVERKLDGVILSIEGLGKGQVTPGGPWVPVHQAFGVLAYDESKGAYRFSAYRADGKFLDVEAKVEDHRLEWGFQDPYAGAIRYVITLNAWGQWTEVGERSADGTTWQRFMEMTLTRVR